MTTCLKPATGAASVRYYVEEVTCGVTPVSPAWNLLPVTSGNMQLTKDTLSSNELDGSRDRADTRLGQNQTSGDFAIEMAYGVHDPLYAALVGNTWAAGTTEAAGDVTVLASAKTFTRDVGDFTTTYAAGDTVKFPSLTGGNAEPFIATSVTALVITGGAIPEGRLADESSVTTDITGADKLVIGTTCTSFSILESYPDLNSGAGGLILTTGVKITNFSFNMAVNALNTGTFQTMGLTQDIDATEPAGSTYPTLTKNEIYSGVDGSIIEDTAVIGFVTGVDSATDTESSAQFELGDNSVSFIEQGRVLSDLTLSTFFTTFDQMNKFADETEVSLALMMESADGVLTFTYPRCVYTSGAPEVSGPGSITASMGASAFAPADGSSIVIQRIT